MYIKLLRNTVADGQPVSIGQILDVSDATGKTLVQMGKAVEFPSPVGRGQGEGTDRAPITVIAVEAQAPIEPVAEPIEPVAEPIEPVAEPIAAAPTGAPPKPKGRNGSQR